jgi:hypothetical protein
MQSVVLGPGLGLDAVDLFPLPSSSLMEVCGVYTSGFVASVAVRTPFMASGPPRIGYLRLAVCSSFGSKEYRRSCPRFTVPYGAFDHILLELVRINGILN